MALFGFGKKKAESTSSDAKMAVSGGSNSVDTLKCIMTAGLRNVDLDVNLSDGDSDPELTHGSFSTSGEQAITTYLDIKGQGASFRPKKARALGDQDRWMQVASDILDQDQQVDKVLNSLNTTLGSQDYLAGQLSLADGHVAASIYSIKKQGKFPGEMSNIDAWLNRVEGKIPDSLRSKYMSHMG